MRAHCTMALDGLTHWLTPQVWREAAGAHRPKRPAARWRLHPLVMVLALMTWTTGDSEAERFATARAFYVARHQRTKRPGDSLAGFQKALARLPLPVLHALFAALRRRLVGLYERCWCRTGFAVVASDGSRQECPRSAELEKRLGCCSKRRSAPMLYLTSLVLLPAGVLWSWRVGPGTASEHAQLREILPTLPRRALLVADACYLGYDLFAAIRKAPADFLVRVSSRAYLYRQPGDRRPVKRYREGWVYYWPGPARKQGHAPLLLRLIRVPAKKGRDVWLLTSVRDGTRLTHRQAAQIYRWRWQIEGGLPDLQANAAEAQAVEPDGGTGLPRSGGVAVGVAVAAALRRGPAAFAAGGRVGAWQPAPSAVAAARRNHDHDRCEIGAAATAVVSAALGGGARRRTGPQGATEMAAKKGP